MKYHERHNNLTFLDYAMPTIEEHVDIYFKELKDEVLEQIHIGLTEEEIKNGVKELCDSLVSKIVTSNKEV